MSVADRQEGCQFAWLLGCQAGRGGCRPSHPSFSLSQGQKDVVALLPRAASRREGKRGGHVPREIMKQQAKERARCFLKRKHDQGERKKGRMVMLLSRPTPPSSRASPVGRGQCEDLWCGSDRDRHRRKRTACMMVAAGWLGFPSPLPLRLNDSHWPRAWHLSFPPLADGG